MSTSSDVSLGAIRLQAQQRADLENNSAVSTQEWNQYISQSYKELYDLLVAAYGNDYYVATTYQFNLNSAASYALPDGTPTYQNSSGTTAQKFYKLLGVDLQYSSSPSGWITLRRFEFIERNKYQSANTAIAWNGYSNLRYRMEGNNLFFVPTVMPSQVARLWYVPSPTSLQFLLPVVTANAGAIGSLSDTTGLSIGMNAAGLSFLPANTTVSGISSTSVTFSSNALTTTPSAIISFWNDSATLDGVNGWEEYIVIDAAIKAQIKQEGPHEPLLAQKMDMRLRIEAMAEGRDAGQAQHVSDVLGAQAYGYDDFGGMGDI